MAAVEPEQYYYPEADFHVTIMDLISANVQFTADENTMKAAREIVENALTGIASFDIHFQGIVASNGAILAKGYYHEGLMPIRDRIRRTAIERGFDLKERYQSISAHTTIARFRSKISNSDQLLSLIEDYRNVEIGTVRVNELALMVHDWYHHRKTEIHKFFLNRTEF